MNFSDVAIIFLKVMIIKIVLTWIVSIKPTKDSMKVPLIMKTKQNKKH